MSYNNDNYKKDIFDLFDLSDFEDFSDNEFNTRREILNYIDEHSSQQIVVWYTTTNTHYPPNIYVGIKTESKQYYLDHETKNSSVINRYLMLLLPSNLINNKHPISLDLPSLKTYVHMFFQLQKFSLLKSNLHSYKNFFILDELVGDINICRLFKPDIEHQFTYIDFVFNADNMLLLNSPLMEGILDEYISKHQLTTESFFTNDTLSPHDSHTNDGLYCFKNKANKLLKNIFKQHLAYYAENLCPNIICGEHIHLGLIELKPNNLFIFLQTEYISKPNIIKRLLVFPISMKEFQFLSIQHYSFLINILSELIIHSNRFLILEFNGNNAHFNLKYEINNLEEINSYCLYLAQPKSPSILDSSISIFKREIVQEDDNNNIIHISSINELAIINNTNKLPELSELAIDESFHVCMLEYNIKPSLYFNSETNSHYYFFDLNFLTKPSFSPYLKFFNSLFHSFSFCEKKDYISYNNEIIGFIQRHKMFLLSKEDFLLIHKYLSQTNLTDNHGKQIIQSLIDKYMSHIEKPLYYFEYLEYFHNGEIKKIIKYYCPVRNNTLDFLSKIFLVNNSKN